MRSLLFTLIFLTCSILFAQAGSKRMTRAEYIATYKDDAIEEMQRTGIPASITLAQGILESGDGNSALARYAKNHFGIKCHSDWKGPTFTMDDDAKDECFRKYRKVIESYKDHSAFLTGRNRYAFLFELKITDYKGWAKGLKKAGYATNPKYPDLLIGIIEKNQLYKFDDPKAHKKDQKQLAEKKDKKEDRSKSNKGSTAYTSKNGNHKVATHDNNIKYVIAKSNDNLEDIADEFNMGLWQITKYNDLEETDSPELGDIIYLQPKRGKAKKDIHIVNSGETLLDISQMHGVKLKKLWKRNRVEEGYQPKVGEKIYLNKKRP